MGAWVATVLRDLLHRQPAGRFRLHAAPARQRRRTPPGPETRSRSVAMSADTYRARVGAQFGARGDGNTNDTASIQSAIDYANGIGAAVFFPAAMYRVSQIVLRRGTILQGVSSGTYPDNNHDLRRVHARAAREHQQAPGPRPRRQQLLPHLRPGDRREQEEQHRACYYGGCASPTAASGQESQIIVERCYFHTNPDSNVYLGRNRRANSVQNSVFNYSLKGDGITAIAGSDNTRIAYNIIGSNARVPRSSPSAPPPRRTGPHHRRTSPRTSPTSPTTTSTATQSASRSPGRLVGLHDRGQRHRPQQVPGHHRLLRPPQNALVTNTFHSNGTAKDDTYAHIDVGQNVTQVCISNNNFSPLDSDVTNVASFCMYVAPGATRVIGDIGAADPTTARALTNCACRPGRRRGPRSATSARSSRDRGTTYSPCATAAGPR